MQFFAQCNLFGANVYMCYDYVHLENLSDISAYRNHNVILYPVPNQLQSRGVSPCRAQWLRGRPPDSRLREPGFESCAAVLKPWASFFTLHCSSSLLSCLNEYLIIDSGGYVYEQPSCINCSIWLDACERSRDGV